MFKAALLITGLVFHSSDARSADQRYNIQSNVLYFDVAGEFNGYENTGELERSDTQWIRTWLADNPSIATLGITGPGGSGPAAREIADLVLQHDLNTIAFSECSSACVTIFLAGKHRTLQEGAKLGFHRPYVEKAAEKAYYEANKEIYGWNESWDYVPWIYDVGLQDMLRNTTYILGRGVQIDFITQAYSNDSYTMWYPSIVELEEAGVIHKSP